jgi:hypothetical protein
MLLLPLLLQIGKSGKKHIVAPVALKKKVIAAATSRLR